MKEKTTKKISQDIAESSQIIELTHASPLELVARITHPVKKIFLEHFYANDGNVSLCTSACGIHRRTFYHWMETDPDFNELITEQRKQLLDDMDSRLRERAKTVRGTAELIFWLKTHHPDYQSKDTIAYRDNDKEFVLTRGH